MLNRRLLRVKVMQALYGLKQAEKSDYFLSLDHIAEIFAPDLNSMEPQNPVELKEKREAASDLFSKSFSKNKPDLNLHPEKIRNAASEAIELFSKRLKKDQKHYKSQMLNEIERIYENYILSLRLLMDLVEYSEDDEEESKSKYIQTPTGIPKAVNLRNNQCYKILREDNELEIVRVKRNLSWVRDEVRSTYKSEIKKNEEIIQYLKQENPDFEEDRKILIFIAKNIIFKNKNLQEHFEERDYNWQENVKIVKSLVVKTLKSLEEGTTKTLIDISGNWEEDKEFFEELYELTLDKEEEMEKHISEKAKNWDVERIALTDNIILKMALAEMIGFPSIPVKVTINEYIELSKTYSTPKSKQFINGMLDSLSQELQKNGVIRKSGRGLIDNK